jgi:hypothetical protein
LLLEQSRFERAELAGVLVQIAKMFGQAGVQRRRRKVIDQRGV